MKSYDLCHWLWVVNTRVPLTNLNIRAIGHTLRDVYSTHLP